GAIALDHSFESFYTLQIMNHVTQSLQNNGATVVQTRSNNSYISLPKRVLISEKHQADAFVSLHLNSNQKKSSHGMSTHYYHPGDRTLALDVQQGLTRHVSLANRGVMQSNYHVLRENNDPAVLIELGFLTNPQDFSKIQQAQYQENVGQGIADGLLNYFGS